MSVCERHSTAMCIICELEKRIEALERFSLKGNKFEKIFVDGKEVKVYPNYSEIADD